MMMVLSSPQFPQGLQQLLACGVLPQVALFPVFAIAFVFQLKDAV